MKEDLEYNIEDFLNNQKIEFHEAQPEEGSYSTPLKSLWDQIFFLKSNLVNEEANLKVAQENIATIQAELNKLEPLYEYLTNALRNYQENQ